MLNGVVLAGIFFANSKHILHLVLLLAGKCRLDNQEKAGTKDIMITITACNFNIR